MGCLPRRPLHSTPPVWGYFLPQSFLPSKEQGFPPQQAPIPSSRSIPVPEVLDPVPKRGLHHPTRGVASPGQGLSHVGTQHPASSPRELVSPQQREFCHQYALSQAIPTAVFHSVVHASIPTLPAAWRMHHTARHHPKLQRWPVQGSGAPRHPTSSQP